MERKAATQIFESLSSSIRLDIYRLLIKQGTEGMVAGQIAATCDIPPNGASFHLKAMTHAGLISVQQEGRFQRYRANLPVMLELIAYLTEECCAGNPQLCAGLPATAPTCPDAAITPFISTTQEN